MPIDLSQRDVSEAFGVTTRQVRNWEADGLVCRADGNRKLYPLASTIRFYRDLEVEKVLRGVTTSEMEAARLRKLQAEAEYKELDLQMRRGELVPMDDVEDLVRESLEGVDSVLRHSPSRFAPKLAKVAKVPIKTARSMLGELIESVRAAIRESANAA